MDSMVETMQPELESAARRYAEGCETVDVIVEDTGFSLGRLARAAAKLGLDTSDRRRVLRSLRTRIDDMKSVDAVDFLYDLCDRLLVDETGRDFCGFRMMGFSPAEARVLSELNRRRGTLVPHETLAALSNPSRNFEADALGVLKVYVSKIRAKFAQSDYPVDIKTFWGDGYTMTVPQNYRWPWEADQ